ncbi:MAG: cysteine--tRNA ligase, partial [Clostridia bacterium]|nr:cysteine--tRNA ligase [Clostridia bacterium]
SAPGDVVFEGCEPDEAVKALALERAAAKRSKDFARADALRAEIAALGYAVIDTPQGPRITK